MELVSVIMPNYNGANFIFDAIQSVINQTYDNWELIIVDDCSKDNSVEIIRRFQEKDLRIKLKINSKPSGSPAEPRNMAIGMAKGRYIAFLDSDDCWQPEKLEKQLRCFNSRNIALVYSSYEKIDQLGLKCGKDIIVPSSITYKQLLKGNCIGCLTVIYDRKLVGDIIFKKIGHEDYLMWLTILKGGLKAVGVRDVLAKYRVTNNSVSSNKLQAAKWYWTIIRKEEHISLLKSIYYFYHYAIFSLEKHIR